MGSETPSLAGTGPRPDGLWFRVNLLSKVELRVGGGCNFGAVRMRDRGADRAARTHLALIAEMRQEQDGDHLWEMASVEIVFLRLGCDAICHLPL